MLRAALALAVGLGGCTRAACVAPETCASICDRYAGSSSLVGGMLDDACACIESCDLGICRATPTCPP